MQLHGNVEGHVLAGNAARYAVIHDDRRNFDVVRRTIELLRNPASGAAESGQDGRRHVFDGGRRRHSGPREEHEQPSGIQVPARHYRVLLFTEHPLGPLPIPPPGPQKKQLPKFEMFYL